MDRLSVLTQNDDIIYQDDNTGDDDMDDGPLPNQTVNLYMSIDSPEKSTDFNVYCRIRKLMPWESFKVSIKYRNSTTIDFKHGDGTINQFTFDRVFGMTNTNTDLFNHICEPMIDRMLQGYNAILMCYGQINSGKTHTIIGKNDANICGLISMTLLSLLTKQRKTIELIQLSAVEAYGYHESHIQFYDLFDKRNNHSLWSHKQGKDEFNRRKLTKINIENIKQCESEVSKAQKASHNAPLGRNPESSRGQIVFIIKITQMFDSKQTRDGYFLFVDLGM